MSAITISLFGSLQVTGPSGQLIPVNGAKLQGLLSYLALNSEVFPTRDRLASIFWGERFTEQSRQSLRQSILKLRKLLNANGVDVLTTQNDRVGLRQEHVEIDVDRFVNLVAANEPQSDLQATKLYSGELLGDLYVRELEFEDWLLSERQRITTIACPAFERAANYLVQRGNSEAALDISRRLIAFDPLREPSYCLQMRILAQSGQRAAAVQLYNQCAAVLARELQVEPGPETRKLLEEIRHVGFESPADTGEAAARGDVLPASQTAAPQAARKPGSTIAVLPFAGTLRGTDEDRLALMFADDLTEALSRYRWLDVMASPVAGSDRLTSEEMQRFSRDNGLKYAVSGSIRRTEEKVRLTVQLIVLEHGRYAWVRHFDWEGGDLSPGIPEQLRDRIAASIEAELVSLEGVEARLVDEAGMTAWDCYHRGLSVQYEFTHAANEQAQRLFRRALELDPAFASAYARLSYAMVLAAVYFGADYSSGLLDEALELAQKGCRLDPRDAVCRFALGRVHLARGEYERSVLELEKAIELNPGMAQAHCGLGDSLTYSGRPMAAMPSFEEAVRLSPQDPYRWAFLSYGAAALLFSGEYEKSAQWSGEAVLEPNCHFWAKALRASALGHLGRSGDAASALEELKRDKPDLSCDYVRSRLFYLRDRSQVDTYVEGLRKAGLE